MIYQADNKSITYKKHRVKRCFFNDTKGRHKLAIYRKVYYNKIHNMALGLTDKSGLIYFNSGAVYGNNIIKGKY